MNEFVFNFKVLVFFCSLARALLEEKTQGAGELLALDSKNNELITTMEIFL